MTARTVILLDMDGVLIEPQGYLNALRDAVDYLAIGMSLTPPGLTSEEIAFFESCGMTNEWLSGAFCLATILFDIAHADPTVLHPTLDATRGAVRRARIQLDRPSFIEFAQQILSEWPGGLHRSEPILTSLTALSPPELHPVLTEILADIHPPHAPAAQMIQNLVLGAEAFTTTYDQAAGLDAESYLLTRDRPFLTPDMRDRLLFFASQDHQAAAIYTARPSLALNPHSESNGYSPEAEMGAELLALTDLPLIAGGHMHAAALQKGVAPDSYIKPSPVQALAALATALSGDAARSIESAIQLIDHDRVTEDFAELFATPVRAFICEDGFGGIQGGHEAVSRLQAAGFDATLTGIGIAHDLAKQQALARVAKTVVPDINTALTLIFDEKV